MEAQLLHFFAWFWNLFGLWDTVWAIGGPFWPLVWVLIKIVAILLPLLGVVAYYTLAARKILGWMHIRMGPNRVGPGGLL